MIIHSRCRCRMMNTLRLRLPHDEHPEASPPNSTLELILNPYPRKSTVTGFAFSSKSLSMINLKPFTSYTLSVSLGSSRAIANEGPPHPPSLRKIRIGTTSLRKIRIGTTSRSVKYSEICWLAASVTSTITSSLIWNMWSARFNCGNWSDRKISSNVNNEEPVCQW